MNLMDPTNIKRQFDFGRNWADFATSISDQQIDLACDGLQRLLGGRLTGQSFLDLGSGSGLSSLAALRLGAGTVLAVDIDEFSVETTKRVLRRFAPGGPWVCRRANVFELDPDESGGFDVVYSWGVLHHTGDMHLAIRRAASLVGPDGRLAIAIYRKTPLCWVWGLEKRLYSKSPDPVQVIIRWTYQGASIIRFLMKGWNPVRFIREYPAKRGMLWKNDVHDWLGGYPYESASPAAIERFVEELGFSLLASWTSKPGLGLFGSGCDEFVFRRLQF